MRERKMSIDLSEKQCALMGASYYICKYIQAHVEGFKIEGNTPEEHSTIFKQALHELNENVEEYEMLGTTFLNRLEYSTTQEGC